MAAALIARRNEPQWGDSRLYMRNPYSNLNPNKPPGTNPNPNPSSAHASTHLIPPDYSEPPPATVTISSSSSSLDRRRAAPSTAAVDLVTIKISECSRKELRALKRQLVAELELVRAVARQVESKEILVSARSVGRATAGTGDRKKQFTPNSRPVVSPKGTKRLAAAPESEKLLSGIMGKCKQILTRLLKQKSSFWFNKPVDVVGMNLHDYHLIVKKPMDLGTVKSNLYGGLYASPLEFAADVRLTFNNALLYNPQGHGVNTYAGQLLRLFESEFGPVHDKYEKHLVEFAREEERQKVSAWSQPDVAAVKAEHGSMVSRPAPVLAISPPQVLQVQMQRKKPISTRPEMVGRLPKPKVNDMNKRPMYCEEKGKLADALQMLPQEKMEEVLEIVRRRNTQIVQRGNGEVEIDFEVMDIETLWELDDRFVSNSEKSTSKVKRQEEPSVPPLSVAAEVGYKSPMRAESANVVADTLITTVDHGEEEDVDIGEDLPCANYPSIEIDKDNARSSSSSDSDSSSSSDSDSESSSGSDFDEDNSIPALHL